MASPVTQQERILLQCRRHKRHTFDSWVRKIPWRKKWQPTPVFLPGESHGQRSLAGYSLLGYKESDMTEKLRMHTHTNTHIPGRLNNAPQRCVCVCAKLLQSCLSQCDPMDCSPPGSSVRGILQARKLE